MALYRNKGHTGSSGMDQKKVIRILTAVLGAFIFICTIFFLVFIAFEDQISNKLNDISAATDEAFAKTEELNYMTNGGSDATEVEGLPKTSWILLITNFVRNIPKVAISYLAFGFLVIALILYYISLVFTTLFASALKVPSDPSYEDIMRNDMRGQMINSVNSPQDAFKRKGLFYAKIIFAFHIPITALMLLSVALIAFKYRADLQLLQRNVEPEKADAIPREAWIMVIAMCFIVYISIALTFFIYLSKLKKIEDASSDVTYELLLANNLAANDGEFMGAIKQYLVSSWKVNPYAWPPVTIERSFDNSPQGVENMVRMMLTYRLASYFATNVASFDNDARAGIINSLSGSSMLKARLAGLGKALSLASLKSGSTFSTDMAPTNRFVADSSTQSYDDVAALNELFRCPANGCPKGSLTFAQFHAKYFNQIEAAMRGISNDLLDQVSTSGFGQKMAYRYEMASGFSKTFTGVHKNMPLVLIFVAMGFSAIMFEGNTRTLSAGILLILFIVPFILERKVKSFGGF